MPYPPLQVVRRTLASRQRIQLQASELLGARAGWTSSEVRPTLVGGQAALTRRQLRLRSGGRHRSISIGSK